MNLSDWFKDVGSQVSERVRSPLYSVFILSWITTNWKAFYVTVFENSKTLGASKLAYIENTLYPIDSCLTYCKLIVVPAIFTGLFIWWFPQLVFKAFKVTEKFSQERRVEKMAILGQSVVKGERYMELRKKYDEQIKGYIDLINDEKTNQEKLHQIILEKEKLELKIKELENNAESNRLALERTKSELSVTNTVLETANKKLAKFNYKPEDVFDDVWLSTYRIPGGSDGREFFRIFNGNKYVVADSAFAPSWRDAFLLENFNYDVEAGIIKFTKCDLTHLKRPSFDVELRKIKDDYWEGVENGDTTLTLAKVIKGSIQKI